MQHTYTHTDTESKSFEPEDLPHNKRRRDTVKKKRCQKVAAKMTMRTVMVVVVKARRMMERALLNEVECRMAVLVDTCSFLPLLIRYLS